MNILSVHGRVWLFVCVLLSLFTNRTDADIVCNTVAGATVVDFAFAIDTSGSMCPYIEQLTDSLAYFALKLQNLNVDARFAVIAFGGKPQILLPFTADSKLTASTLRNIDCTGGGQEASLEAIRALLAPNYGADFLKSCEYYKQKNGKSGDDYCNIIWRTNAKKNIILITDEDSDLPTLRNYRVRNQTSSNALCANRYSFSSGTPYCSSSSANFEPNWEPKAYWSRYNTFFRTDKGMVIDPAYQYEIDLTASLVVASDVSINMLINSGVNPATSNPQSYYDSRNLYWIATKSKTTPNYKDSLQTTVVQFGDPSLTATDDTLLKFDSALTLKYLIANGLGKSLQGRVLAAGGFLRLFEINDLLKTTVSSNGNTFTQNFYNATANSVTTCITIPGTNPHSDLPPPILTDIAPVPSSLLTTTTTKTTATTTTTKTTSTTSTTPTKTTSSTTTTSTTTTPTTTTTSTSSTTTSTSTSTTTTSTATSTTTSTSTSTTTTSTTITTSTSTTSTTSTATTSTTSTTTTDTTSTTSTTTTDTTSTTSTTSTATTSTTSTTSTDTTSTTSTMTASAASTPTQITASTPSTNVGLVSAATTTPFTSEKTSTTTTTTTSTTSTETTTTTRTTSTTTDSTTTSSTTTDTTTTSSTTTTDTTTTTSDTTTTTTTDTTTTTTTSTTTTDTTTTTTTSTTTTDSTTTTSTTTTTTTDTTTTTTTDTTTTTTTTDSTTTSDTTTTTSTTTSDTPTSTTTTTTTFTPVIIPNVFCGGGVVGNGTCLISGQCCSQYGYCDVGLDYCGTTDASEEYIDPQDEGMANSTIPGSDTCGYGVIGNGICDDSLLECSKWGWCMPAEVTGTPKPAPTYDPNGVIEGTETPQPNTDSGTEEKSTLSNTALAGGVGAGVLCLGAAASLFVLRRNRSSQMVSLFSVGSGDVFGNQVADNPLYRKEGNYVENPLFKVANEPVKGTAETADNV